MLDKMSLKVLKSVKDLESFEFEDVQKIVENLSETRIYDIIQHLSDLKYIGKKETSGMDGVNFTYRVLPSGFAFLEKDE